MDNEKCEKTADLFTPDLNAELEQLTIAAEIESVAANEPMAAAIEQQQADNTAEFKTLLVAVLSPLGATVAPNWQLQPAEIDALSDAYAAVLVEYFPAGVGDVGPWAGALITTAAIIGPRLSVPRRLPPPQNDHKGCSGNEER